MSPLSPDAASIQDLVELALETGRDPRDVCADRPDLLGAVTASWERAVALRDDLDALFPSPDGAGQGPGVGFRAADPPLVPGHAVEAVLGTGGTGVVYRARNLKLGRAVAVKMLLLGRHARPRELEALLREARAVAGLQHPHVVQVFEVGELDGLPYFTMELLEGGTLCDRLRAERMLPRDAASLVAVLADAVGAAHRGGVVHRDLKPANVLLTASGTPKIADFSLARPFGAAADATLVNPMGTPAYMAPEQALGGARAFEAPVDIYALGVILYEALTGAPPFRADSPAETLRRAMEEPPTPPSRHNAAVPRDLETICLKCLEREPERRYASAAALGDDLHRFLRGEPVLARRAGRVERALKWVRRRPSQATAVAACVICLAVVGAVIVNTALTHARATRLVRQDLAEVATRQRDGDWSGAQAALARSRARLDAAPSPALLAEIERAEHDLDTVARLDTISLTKDLIEEGRYTGYSNSEAMASDYARAFRDWGVDAETAQPAEAAALIRASCIATSLVAAIDDWASAARTPGDRDRRAWLLRVASHADPSPNPWRTRAREPEVWDDPDRLGALLGDWSADEGGPAPGVESPSPSLLIALAERYKSLGGDPTPFLRRVQQAYPSDFWSNFRLGLALTPGDPGESVRYFQASVALRPNLGLARLNLGVSLAKTGDMDGALTELGKSVELSPDMSATHNNYANALLSVGRRDEALAEYRRAVELDPEYASARSNLGKILIDSGRPAEALEHFRVAVEGDPKFANAQTNMGLALHMLGRTDEAMPYLRRALELEPDNTAALINLSLALRSKGQIEESRVSIERAVELKPDDAEIRFYYANFLASQNDAEGAREAYEQSLRLDPRFVRSLLALGVMEGEARDFDAAVARFRAAVEIDPTYPNAVGALARCLMLQGQFAEAADIFEHFLSLIAPDDPRHAPIRAYIDECRARAAE